MSVSLATDKTGTETECNHLCRPKRFQTATRIRIRTSPVSVSYGQLSAFAAQSLFYIIECVPRPHTFVSSRLGPLSQPASEPNHCGPATFG